MKKTLGLFFALLISTHFGVVPHSFATSDSGEIASLVGLMGGKQEYALVMISTDLHGSGTFSLTSPVFAVDMRSPKTQVVGPIVKIDMDQGKVLKEVDGIKTVDEAKVRKSYLAKLKPEQSKMFGNSFIPAKKIKQLKWLPQKKDAPKATASQSGGNAKGNQVGAFQVKNNKHIDVWVELGKTFDAMKPEDTTAKIPCAIVDKKSLDLRLTCSNCSFKPFDLYGIKEDLPVCSDGPGELIVNEGQELVAKSGNVKKKKGSSCNCHSRGFEVLPQLRLTGASQATSIGMPFLLHPFMAELYDGSGKEFPSFKKLMGKMEPELSAYKNKDGQIIVLGSLVHTPKLNATYFPIVAVSPGS